MTTDQSICCSTAFLEQPADSATVPVHHRRILVIDDNPSIHSDFVKILGSPSMGSGLTAKEERLFGESCSSGVTLEYEVDTAWQGEEGLDMIAAAVVSGQSYSVAFVDVRMPPGLDGVATVERAARLDPNLQLVLCTTYADHTAQQVIDRMGTTDRLLFLRKPFDAVAVDLLASALTEKWRLTQQIDRLVESQQNCISRLDRVVKLVETERQELAESHSSLANRADTLSRRLLDRTVEILGTRDAVVFALAHLAEARDPAKGDHLFRIREYAQTLAEYLATDSPYAKQIDRQFLRDLYRATPLHDIGQVSIPDDVLLKPGPLTAEEVRVMQQHAQMGAEVLERTTIASPFGSFLGMAVDIARHHHERFDGQGYPDGLQGTQIPLAARFVAVADVFDALTSQRRYRDAIDVEEACEMILRESGSRFDPEIVSAFEACLERFVQIQLAATDEWGAE